MTDNGAESPIRRATTHDSLDHLSQAAFSRAQVARGGAPPRATLGSDVDSDRVRNALAADVDAGLVWVAEDAGEIIAGVSYGIVASE